MTCQTCALPGCSKPAWESRGGSTPHLACGRLHHNLLMAGRFNPSAPHPYNSILDRKGAQMCALHSCAEPPWLGHSWCSKGHYLVWLEGFASSLQPDQICKLPSCIMHVFVGEDNTRSHFGGWNHCQEFVKLIASRTCGQDQFRDLNVSQYRRFSPISSEDECGGCVPSIESLIQSLKGFANSGIVPQNIKFDVDFFSKHPWEVFREKGQAHASIVKCNFLSKGRRAMGTKDGYHWKQTGPPTKKGCGCIEKNYVYKEMKKGKEKDVDGRHEQMVYRMKEYTVENVKSYSLVICKVQPSSYRGKCPGNPTINGKGNYAELNDVCSLGFLTSNLGFIAEEFSVDSLFKDLQPLDDCS